MIEEYTHNFGFHLTHRVFEISLYADIFMCQRACKLTSVNPGVKAKGFYLLLYSIARKTLSLIRLVMYLHQVVVVCSF